MLAELISDLKNSRTEDPRTTVFKLLDLRKEFCKRLKLQGVTAENPEIHSMRLKEKIIEAIPGLTAHIKGREVLLVFEEDIGSLISHPLPGDNDDNAMCLERTANIVREEMFNESSSVTGSVTQSCQKGSVPQGLLSLVTMILEGPNAKCQLTGKPSQAALTLAELLKFNSVKHACKTEQCTRHIKSQETPLPVYIGVMLHVKTRKRDLIDRLHALGMSISYDHVLRLSSDMANAVCEHFKETQTVCPPNLKRNVFTTAAVDNIDHNTSSTTAITSFHGKSISLIQHPNVEGEGVSNAIIKRRNLSAAKTIAPLPSSYTNILPLSSQKQGGLKVPITSTQCSLKGNEEAVLMATRKET